MKKLIGVDPSFTRTGIVLFEDDGSLKHCSASRAGENYQVVPALQHATELVKEFRDWLSFQEGTGYTLIHEYPAFQSKTGPYLGMLTSKFDSYYRVLIKTGFLKEVYFVPPTAVAAYTGIRKDHTALVEYAKTLLEPKKIKINHDVATAVVLAKIGEDITQGKYKRSFFKLEL